MSDTCLLKLIAVLHLKTIKTSHLLEVRPHTPFRFLDTHTEITKGQYRSLLSSLCCLSFVSLEIKSAYDFFALYVRD